jgi:xanthine dehydrogenase iron-sulfur cluster and FAD-binding subunit A
MVIVATALLDHAPVPGQAAIAEAFSGNICRCTGYEPIVAAVLAAAAANGTDSGHAPAAHAPAGPHEAETDEGADGPVLVGPETQE